MVVRLNCIPSACCLRPVVLDLEINANHIVKGTFGPMASAFSVCALVENWRVVVPPGGNEAHGMDVKDPKW